MATLALVIPVHQFDLPLGGLSELGSASFVVWYLQALGTAASDCWHLKSNAIQEATTVILFPVSAFEVVNCE